MMQKKSPIMALFLVLVFAVVLIMNPQSSKAEEARSIALEFHYDGNAVENAEFELYRVGDIDITGSWKVTIDAKLAEGTGYEKTDIAGLEDDVYRSLAVVLGGKVAEAELKPEAVVKTDKDGKAVFEDMENGLYLICMKPVKIDSGVLTGQPILAIMPTLGNDGLAKYEQEIFPKPLKLTKVEDLEVKKVWADSNHEKERPAKVTILLYADKVLYDTQELSKENNWTYRWKDLDSEHTWTLVEKTDSPNYKVSMTQEGRVVIVKNTYGDVPPDNPPKKPPTPDIPVTGQLWWPVPVCAILGMLFFAYGWFRHQRSKDI